MDLPVWLTALLFIMRALRRDARWWLAAGAVVGIATYNKFLIALLLIALLLGLLLAGDDTQHGRRALLSRWLWLGVVIAFVVAIPNLIYQISHDWPQVTMAESIAGRSERNYRAQLIPFQFILVGPLMAPVWIAGLVAMFRNPSLRPLRALAWAYPLLLLIVLLAGGQMYYPLGLLVALFAIGCTTAEQWVGDRPRRRMLILAAGALNALGTIVLALPVVPVTSLKDTPLASVNGALPDELGWEQYTEEVADVYKALSPEDQVRAVIITANYGEAGALEQFGSRFGLPETIYSGHNQLYYRATPPATSTVGVVVGIDDPAAVRDRWESCKVKARLDNQLGVDNEEQNRPVYVCHGPRQPWSTLWRKFQHYN